MDKPVPHSVVRRRKVRSWLIAGIVMVPMVLAAVGLSRLGPALPVIERSSVYTGTVQRGDMVLQVAGNGTLVPEQIKFVVAETEGRIERILVQPGAAVTADTILMELSNAALAQETFDAEWQLKVANAQFTRLRAQLTNDRLALESSLASLKVEVTKAEQEARSDEDLTRKEMVPTSVAQRSRLTANAIRHRFEIEQQRLTFSDESIDAQLSAQQAEVERAKAALARKRDQVAALRVAAGVDGVLQQIGDTIALQAGQRVTPSTTLAKIVEPTRLKAVLKIAETQARDVQIGQHAKVDTRNGVVPGQVARVDPAAQNGTVNIDVRLEGALPKGARPDLNVDGVIQLERLDSVLFVRRPIQSQPDSAAKLFMLVDGGSAAQRVTVKFGRTSVSDVEIVDGLHVGDQIILSDTSAWEQHERIRLQ